jgi:two-component system chemotaxis response regulator CheY
MWKPGTKILVVDDQVECRKSLITTLQFSGYLSVSGAHDGFKAWSSIEAAARKGSPYELVISDCNMPVMTGLDLLRAIRTDELTSKLSFILVTGVADAMLVQDAAEMDVDAFLVKPFPMETLKEKLEAVFKKRFG